MFYFHMLFIYLFIHLSLFEILTPPKKKTHHHLKLPPHNPSPP